MGITGLLPFLEKSKVSRPANIKEFKGCTVAADAYCWLHKGAFSCADKLARGEQTDMYVQYCMKYVNMLLANDIKPILVFDGRHLPAKAHTEKKRREKREENRKQAASLLRQGHTTEALSFLRRCIDVTHAMALKVMQECRKRNVDCIVAPYEADAQLAFFSIEGIADLVITEDSDLLLFGCKRVMFKLDLAGNGVLVDQERLHSSMGVRPENYSFDKFRYMCILSGCDYLDSLPGIGLGKACKFITRTQDPDMHKALSRLPAQLNIRGLTVSMDYRDDFMKADAMFRHQLVFDPQAKKAKPLTPHQSVHPGSPLAAGPLPGCIPEFDAEMSYQLALGNLDPFKLTVVDEYDPMSPRNENQGVKTQGWNQTAIAPHPSVWDPKYFEKITKSKPCVTPSFMPSNARPITNGRTISVDTNKLAKTNKRCREEDHDSVDVKRVSLDLKESNLTAMYSSPVVSTVSSSDTNRSPACDEFEGQFHEPTSPILSAKRRPSRNPFARSTQDQETYDEAKNDSPSDNSATPTQPINQPGKFSALNKFARATQRTSTDGKPIVQSRYFGNNASCSPDNKKDNQDETPSNLLRDVSNTMEDGSDQEFDMMKLYKKTDDVSKVAMIHKKPLFASLSNSSKEELEDIENGSSVDTVLNTMNARFRKQSSEPLLTKSPSKNPFKRDSTFSICESEESNDVIKTERKIKQLCCDEDEDDDVDDPGFVSSSSSTPCSLSEATQPLVLSQSDDGFQSPSKLTPPMRASPARSADKKLLVASRRKSTCRISGLKKPPSVGQGQCKLSAFGFTPKPKIQHS